jgi:hypothetical protein
MVLSVEPVEVLHVIGAESSAASVPETWATSAETRPQKLVFSFALTEGFSTAAFHLAGGVWKSEVLLLPTFWWGNSTETIAAVVSKYLNHSQVENISATGMNLIFDEAVGWWVLLPSLAATTHGHWWWGHSTIRHGGCGG